MMRRMWAATGVGAVVSVATLSLPATAEVQTFDDGGDTGSSLDIRSIRVDNAAADADELRIRFTLADVRLGDELTVFIDKARDNPGPEWKISGFPESEWTLLKVDNWKPGGDERIVDGASMRINTDTDLTRIVLPRAGLGKHLGKVRIAVRALRDRADRVDWAKARHTFLPWVERGDARVFDDAGDMASSLDIQSVRVDNAAADPDELRIRFTLADVRLGDELTVFIDKAKTNPGPEWKITGAPFSEWALLKVDNWEPGGDERIVDGSSMRINTDTDVTRIVLPRAGLGKHLGKVRIAVYALRDDPHRVDWAKASRTFLPWVERR